VQNSLDQYLKCQKELYDRDSMVFDAGFIVYKLFEDKSIYLHLLYIEEDKRTQGLGTRLTDQLLAHTKAETAYSYIDTTTKNPETSLLAHLMYGFKIYSIEGNSINLIYKKQPKEKGEL